MALPRTPFAPDPGYEHTANFYPKGSPCDPASRGRVRPEASSIARLGTTGSVGLLMQQLQETPRLGRAKRSEPKNHGRENLRRIREIQSKARERREEASKPVKPVIRSDKYQHVQAKVTVHTQSPPKPSLAFQLEPSTGAPRVPPNGTPAPEGRTSLQQGGGRKNFLAANIVGAGRHHVRRPPSREKVEQSQARREREMAQYHRGKVPQYLRQRQEEWRQEEEQRKAAEPDPSVPPGHTLMPAEERRKTLQLLSEHQESLTKELQSLPLRTDTLRLQRRRADLEARLAEVEDALRIFSRPKVFIKMEP